MPLINTSRGRLWAADQRRADGLPLVLVHGAGGSHLVWPGALRRLPNVVALDLPGRGRSEGTPRSDAAAYADDVCALLDALDIPRAVIAGHSLGGAIALMLALDHPDRAAGLILIATGAKLRVHPDTLRDLEANPPAALARLNTAYWAASTGDEWRARNLAAMQALPPRVLLDDFTAADRFDVRERLAALRVPTLIIGGREDVMTPPKHSEYLHAHIADSELVLLENAGHFLMLEQPEAAAAAMRDFLTRRVIQPTARE